MHVITQADDQNLVYFKPNLHSKSVVDFIVVLIKFVHKDSTRISIMSSQSSHNEPFSLNLDK